MGTGCAPQKPGAETSYPLPPALTSTTHIGFLRVVSGQCGPQQQGRQDQQGHGQQGKPHVSPKMPAAATGSEAEKGHVKVPKQLWLKETCASCPALPTNLAPGWPAGARQLPPVGYQLCPPTFIWAAALVLAPPLCLISVPPYFPAPSKCCHTWPHSRSAAASLNPDLALPRSLF